MTPADDAPLTHEEGSFVRPFLERGAGARSAPAPAPETEAADVGVRPYFVTRGRTRTDRVLSIEALVQTTARGRERRDGLQFEQHAIATVCEQAVSVAEVAARVRVPLGVARVLLSDMAGSGLVQIHDAPVRVADDISLIQRLIHGVRSL